MSQQDQDRLVFPIRNQQIHLKTAGWSNFLSSQGFDERLCAIGERYAAAGLPSPTVTVGSGSDSITIHCDNPAERAQLYKWLSTHTDTSLLDSLVQQMHTLVLGLVGHYYNQFSVPITTGDVLGWGVVGSGAKWPDGFVPLDKAYSNLQYTRVELGTRDYPVSFTDKLVPIGFPYVQSVTNVTYNGGLLDESVVEGFTASAGVLGQTHYQTNQRIVSALSSLTRWCQTGFYQPCFDKDLVLVLQAESGNVGTQPPEYYDDLGLHERIVTFEVSGLCNWHRYLLVTTPVNPYGYTPTEGLVPYRAIVKQVTLNGGLLPHRPIMPWEISHLLKCGTNTLRIVYYGDYSWTDLVIAPVIPVSSGFFTDDMGGNVIAGVDKSCWKRGQIADWMNWVYQGQHTLLRQDEVSFDLYSVRSNAPVFRCKTPVSELSEGIPDVTVTPPNPLLGQEVHVEFSKPLEASTYVATLELINPLQFEGDKVLKKQVSSGTASDITTFQMTLPVDCNLSWKVVVQFDNGASCQAAVINFGAIFSDGLFNAISGSVGDGVTCAESCSQPSETGECIKVYSQSDVSLYSDCDTCNASQGGGGGGCAVRLSGPSQVTVNSMQYACPYVSYGAATFEAHEFTPILVENVGSGDVCLEGDDSVRTTLSPTHSITLTGYQVYSYTCGPCTSGGGGQGGQQLMSPPQTTPPTTSESLTLTVSDSTHPSVNGPYQAEFDTFGNRTGVWRHVSNPSLGIVATGMVSEIVDYSLSEVIYSLSNPSNTNPLAANLGTYLDGGGGTATVSE